MVSNDELQFAAEAPDDSVEPASPAPWKVAVVDDDESVRAITRLALGQLKVDGRPLDLLEAASAEEGIALFATHPDIALGLIDMVMEEPSAGLRVISAVREQQGNHRTRLVVRTGQPGHLPEERVIRDYDINDYREKTELSAQKLRTVAHAAIRSFRDIVVVEEAFHGMVELLSQVVDEKIAEYFPHAVASAEVAATLGTLAGLPATRVEAVRHAAVLRDLGLLRLPAGVRNALLQYESLDGEARQAVAGHPMVGARLLERLATVEGRLAAQLAREHHERWDGGGYPKGLRGDEIGLEGRLVAIANLIDALLSPVPERGARSLDELRDALAAGAGAALDPKLVALALAHLDALLAARAQARGARGEIRWMSARDRLLLALSQAAHIDDGDIGPSARAITQAAVEGLGIDRCGIWMRAVDAQSIRCIHLNDLADGGHRDVPDIVLTAEHYPKYFEALARERAIVAHDAPAHPDTAEFAHGYLDVLGIRSMLDCPVRQHGRMVGILCAEHRGSRREWSADEVSFLSSLSDLFGRVLTAAERRDYQQRLEALNASLEERVVERTAELRAALEYLEKAKSHLVEREKMAALGQLVAGVAHEINTPVGVIVTAVSHCAGLLVDLRAAQSDGTLTRTKFDTALAELGDGLEMAQRNAVRAAGLVESFKRTAADQTHDVRSRFELGKTLADVLATLSPMLRRRGVQVRLAEMPTVQCDSYAGSLAQVVTNLVVNACVHGYGDEPTAGARIDLQAGQDGSTAWLRVIDGGAGMPPEVLQKAFEPFYTTARTRGGTGLGLSIVRTLVERTLGGEIRIQTRLGEGCCVDVRFPCHAPG